MATTETARKPRSDRVHATSAERHRAHRQRMKDAQQAINELAYLCSLLTSEMQLLARADSSRYGWAVGLAPVDVMHRLIEVCRIETAFIEEQKAKRRDKRNGAKRSD